MNEFTIIFAAACTMVPYYVCVSGATKKWREGLSPTARKQMSNPIAVGGLTGCTLAFFIMAQWGVSNPTVLLLNAGAGAICGLGVQIFTDGPQNDEPKVGTNSGPTIEPKG